MPLNDQEVEIVTAHQILIKTLKTLDEQQLASLFADIEDISVIERIADTAYKFVEQSTMSPIIINISSHKQYDDEEEFERPGEKSYDDELKDADDSRRYNEWKSDQNRPY